MSSPSVRRGDIFLVDWNPGRSSEQLGTRSAVIIQTDAFNSNDRYPNTIILAISKSGRPVPTHIPIAQTSENGLTVPMSYVKCEQLLTIAKERLLRRLGKVSTDDLEAITTGLKRILSIK